MHNLHCCASFVAGVQRWIISSETKKSYLQLVLQSGLSWSVAIEVCNPQDLPSVLLELDMVIDVLTRVSIIVFCISYEPE